MKRIFAILLLIFAIIGFESNAEAVDAKANFVAGTIDESNILGDAETTSDTFAVLMGTYANDVPNAASRVVVYGGACSRPSACGTREIVTISASSCTGTSPSRVCTLTITARNQESTTHSGDWVAGSKVDFSPTAGTFGEYAPLDSPEFTGNVAIDATYTSIHTFHEDNWNEDDATWTMVTTGPLGHVTGNTTTVTATNTEAIVAGVTYKVTITGTGGGATATYTLGGITGTTIAASGAIAITDYITASTTASMIITPSNTCTVSITSITIEKLTDATGDLTVDGNLIVRSPVYLRGNLYLNKGTVTYPSLSFSDETNMGFYWNYEGQIGLSIAGVRSFRFLNYGFIIDSLAAYIKWSDTDIVRLAANSLAMRTSTNPQTFSIYETYTNVSNYEYYSLDAGVTTADTLTIQALSAGTGSANLNIALMPKGTGKVYANGLIVRKNSSISCVATVCTDVPTSESIYITTTGTDTMTVADGTTAGTRRFFSHKVDGGQIIITPTNFSAGTSITMADAGDTMEIEWNGAKWDMVVFYGGVLNP